MGFASERLREQGLPHTRGAVEQDALGWVLTSLLVDFRVDEWNDGDFLDLLNGVVEPADVGEGNRGNVGATSSDRLVSCINRRLLNQPPVLWLHLGSAEFNRFTVDVDHKASVLADIDVPQAADSCVEGFVIEVADQWLEANALHGLSGQRAQANGLSLVHIGVEPHGGAQQDLTGFGCIVDHNLCNGLFVADHHDGRSGSKAVGRTVLKGDGDLVFSDVGVGLAG